MSVEPPLGGSSMSAMRFEQSAHRGSVECVSAGQRVFVVRDRIELSTFRFSAVAVASVSQRSPWTQGVGRVPTTGTGWRRCRQRCRHVGPAEPTLSADKPPQSWAGRKQLDPPHTASLSPGFLKASGRASCPHGAAGRFPSLRTRNCQYLWMRNFRQRRLARHRSRWVMWRLLPVPDLRAVPRASRL